jgi:hypothetical protein
MEYKSRIYGQKWMLSGKSWMLQFKRNLSLLLRSSRQLHRSPEFECGGTYFGCTVSYHSFLFCCKVSDIVYQSLGWATRYWMVVRDNYLGSFTNFSTLYEYLDKRRNNVPVGDPIKLKYRQGKVSMLSLIYCR